MPEKIFGLPAHPLMIHLPLVLGPVVGLLTVLLLVPKLREKLLLPTAALAVLFAASAIVAVISGQDFVRTLGLGEVIGEHADAAKTLRLLSLILVGALILFVLGRKRLPQLVATGMAVVVAGLGIATVLYTVKTGHEGATLVWKEQYDAAEQAQQDQSGAEDDSAAQDESGSDDESSGEDRSGSDTP